MAAEEPIERKSLILQVGDMGSIPNNAIADTPESSQE